MRYYSAKDENPIKPEFHLQLTSYSKKFTTSMWELTKECSLVCPQNTIAAVSIYKKLTMDL